MDFLGVLSQGEVVGAQTGAAAALANANSANVPPAVPASASASAPAAVPAPVTVQVPALIPNPRDATGQDKRLRVLLCGTYPIGQSNGYSRVVYYIAKFLGAKTECSLEIYGFQNYGQTKGGDARADLPKGVFLHDALAHESPRRHGFGEKEIAAYIKARPQDIVIIFNDMIVTSALVATLKAELTPAERASFKLVSYMDQVYPYQKKMYINVINENFDAVVAFTPYWRDVARSLGVKLPMYVFPHGFDPELYYPIPRDLARIYYNIPSNAFVILNLNRNQPRKRWDHTIMALADVVARHQALLKTAPAKAARPIVLMIATQVDGFWNLTEIFEHELMKRGINWETGKKYIVSLAKPQQMSDTEINVLYNASDIGLNTCEGEGFGLCQFEHAAIGCPQVVANIGGFKEFLNAGNSTLVEPKWAYYIDKQRDGIGGYAEVADPKDVADAIWKYYTNPAMVVKHGKKARGEILRHYRWETMVDYFYKELEHLMGV